VGVRYIKRAIRVLYLASTKAETGFIGAAKAELKLLACQRADQSWNSASGEEVIPARQPI